MRKILYMLMSLPFLVATASAAPQQLSDTQMDKVSAGFLEIDVSNTSLTVLSLFFRPFLLDDSPNTIGCPTCYLLIVSPAFSIASSFGPPTTPPVTVP